MRPILVTGGSGTLGRPLVEALTGAGRRVRVLSRRPRAAGHDGSPAGRVPDLGGPRVLTADELARAYLRAAGRRRPVLRVPVPGAAARGFRDGGHLCPEHAGGKRTWEEFLSERFPRFPGGR